MMKMKKTLKRILIVFLALVLLVAGTGVYLYSHPLQHVGRATSARYAYPTITYTSYSFCHTPPKLAEQSEYFFDTVYSFVNSMSAKYGDGLDLDYTLDYGKNYTIVNFYGTGTLDDGTEESISQSLEFDITIRDDASWY